MPDSPTSSSTFSWILLSDSLVPLGAAYEALEVVDDEELGIEHLDVHQLVLIKGKDEKELKNVTILTNNLPADEHNFSRVLKIVRLSEIDKSSTSYDRKLLLEANSTYDCDRCSWASYPSGNAIPKGNVCISSTLGGVFVLNIMTQWNPLFY